MNVACNIKRSMRSGSVNALLFFVAAGIGVPAPGFAQWLDYPTANVPRKADGRPNLTAPAPRLPDGKPDFSGIWHAPPLWGITS